MQLTFVNEQTQARADSGRNSWWRYLVATFWAGVVYIVLSFLVLSFFVKSGGLKLVLPGATPQSFIKAISSPSSPLLYFGVVAVAFASLLAGVATGSMLFNAKPPRTYLQGWGTGAVLAGGILWLGVILVGQGIDYGLQPGSLSLKANLTLPVILVTIVSIGIQTFTEEFTFRGFVTFGFLHLTKRPIPAAALSAIVFAALHIANSWWSAANALLLGFALSLIAIKTGSLAFGYGVHLVNNLFAAIVVVSSDDIFKGAPALFVQTTHNLDLTDLTFTAAALTAIVLGIAMRPARTGQRHFESQLEHR